MGPQGFARGASGASVSEFHGLERSLPDKIFLKGPRASSTETNLADHHDLKEKDTIASELSELALTTRKTSESPHEAVERFFLRNDSKTICSELPVFLKDEETDLVNIETPLTGHIDLIQERFGKMYIMDYKSNLNRPKNHTSQLLLYKEALHNRTSIPKSKIVPVVFNEHSYYEFTRNKSS
ncbi:MAG: PD-(D/E)XK nuclease family protein [Candidatus Natronoplasma sp.]